MVVVARRNLGSLSLRRSTLGPGAAITCPYYICILLGGSCRVEAFSFGPMTHFFSIVVVVFFYRCIIYYEHALFII